jgi:hypothetical protein
MINNSLNTLYLGPCLYGEKFMKSKTPSKVYSMLFLEPFSIDDGFYVLIALYNVVLLGWCVTTTSYKVMPAIIVNFF